MLVLNLVEYRNISLINLQLSTVVDLHERQRLVTITCIVWIRQGP